jgi:hypothetical protein
MNKTETLVPNKAADVKTTEYDALRITNEEYFKLLSCGHPGGTISIAQAGSGESVRTVAETGHRFPTPMLPSFRRS